MGDSHFLGRQSAGRQSPDLQSLVQERQLGDGRRPAPVPSAALALPVPKVSTGPSQPVPRPERTNLQSANREFRRSGLLPTRESSLQRQERRMFLWIFVSMMLLFAGLLTAILASRI